MSNYTAEQIEAILQCPSEHELFAIARDYAATLRQQTTNPPEIGSKLVGGGSVSDGWDGEAYANMAGELESWKRRALQAEHFIEHEVQGQTFMGEPLLRAPAEQGGRVDEPTLEMCRAMMRAQDESDGEGPREVEMRDMYVAARQAALAQNAQGEVVAWMCETVNGYTAFSRDGKFPCNAGKISPLYLHAERARLPGGWVLVPRSMHIDAGAWETAQFAFGGPGTGEDEPFMDCTMWVGDIIDEDTGIKTHGLHVSCDECPEEGSITLAEFAAAPSQPEDAA